MATINKIFFLLAALVIGLGLLSASGSAWDFNTTVLFPNGTGANSTNVTVYVFANSANPNDLGPQSWDNHTDSNGFVALTGINDSSGLVFKFDIKYSSGPWGNISSNYTGPMLPPMPSNIFVGELSNSTIYMIDAVNINITAFNGTAAPQWISGIILDNKLGIPLDMFMDTPVQQRWAVLPSNRNYTILIRTNNPPSFVGWNMTAFSPPRAYVINNASNYTPFPRYINLNKNISTTLYYVNGTLRLPGGVTNTSNMTYIKVVPYMFVPSVNNMTVYDAMIDNITGLDANINVSHVGTGFFNITLPGPNTDWIIAGFGNDTNISTNATFFAGFRNLTLGSANVGDFDINLQRLAGGFHRSGAVNTSKTVFCFINGDTNVTVTEQVRSEVKTLYNGTQMRWQMQSNATGCINIPLWNGTDVTVTAFGGRFTPREYTVTGAQLDTRQHINISLREFNPQDPDGGAFGTTDLQFLRSNVTCDLPAPPAGCILSSFDDPGPSFSPLKASLGGNISLRITYQGVIIHYKAVDLLASGPPDAEFDSAAAETTSGNDFQSVWKVGSKAPFSVYENVLIGLPYEDSDIDDSGIFNTTLTNLYDDDWNNIWVTASNATNPGARWPEYSDYNTTWFTGMACDKNIDTRINTTQSCYVNTTSNYIWLHLPHFSGGSPRTTAPKATTTSAAAITGGSSGAGGGEAGTASSYWSTIDANTLTTMNVVGIPNLALAAVEFTLSAAADAVKITASALTDKPTTITTDPSGTVYKYFNIATANIDATKLTSATIKFRVDKTWITDNKVKTDTVKLARFTDKWEVLATKQISEDAAYVHYEATTPGFSTFVIFAETIAGEAITAPVAEEEKKPAIPPLEIPAQLQKPANVGLLLVLILVVIFIGYALMKKKPTPAYAESRRRRRAY